MRKYLLLVVAVLLGLQSGAAELSEEQAKRRPRIRLASTPYPTPLFRLFEDPKQFGHHHYRRQFRLSDFERSRGHTYTRRGGMIDLSHLRKTVDWTAWLQASIHRDLTAGKRQLTFRCSEPSLYHLSFDLPDVFDEMSEPGRVAFLRRLSRETALVTGYYALTWHEILTWYGWGAVPGVSERQSAFSIEDMYSHALGIEVARRALTDESHAYDEAVRLAIYDAVEELEPMSKSDARVVLATTKGKWWRFLTTLKHHPYIGYERPIAPCLAPCFPCEDPIAKSAPRLGIVDGIDLAGIVSIKIEPVVSEGAHILGVAGSEDGVIRPDLDFAPIMADIRDDSGSVAD